MHPLPSPAVRKVGKLELRSVTIADRPVLHPRQDARALHARARLWVAGENFDAAPAAREHWSLRRRLAIIVGGSLALWGGLIYGGWLLIQIF